MNILKKAEFIESIKSNVDKEKEMLIRIQNEIEKNGINRKDIIRLTEKLSDSEKLKLKQLYQEQLEKLEYSKQQYKEKIIKIKANL